MDYHTNPFACAFPTLDCDPDLQRHTLNQLRNQIKDLQKDKKELEIERDEIYNKFTNQEDDLVNAWIKQKKAIIAQNDLNKSKRELEKKCSLLENENGYLKFELNKLRDYDNKRDVIIENLLNSNEINNENMENNMMRMEDTSLKKNKTTQTDYNPTENKIIQADINQFPVITANEMKEEDSEEDDEDDEWILWNEYISSL